MTEEMLLLQLSPHGPINVDILLHCCGVDLRGGATGCLHKRGRVSLSLSLSPWHMVVYHVSLSPSQQQLHITRRGDRGEWFSSVEGRRARHSSFVGGEGGLVESWN